MRITSGPQQSASLRARRGLVAISVALVGLAPVLPAGPAGAAPVTDRPCVDGRAGVFACKDVDLKAYIPLADLGGGSASDLWGWRDEVTGHEYALMGGSRGVKIVDITNTSQPVYLGSLAKPDGQFVWQDLEVYRDHVFVVCDLGPCGMQIFDLTRLRGVTTVQTWAPDVVYPVTMTTHTIDINPETGFAYLNGAYLAAPTHIVDVTSPKTPRPAGVIADDGYTHDSFCRIYRGPDTRFAGKEICFSFNEDTINIYDVSNKAAITRLARVTYPGASYVHSGWLTEDSRYLLSTDETDNKPIVFIWDVQLLDAPRLHATYTGTTTAIEHNPYIVGRWAYMANYRAGMRVLDTVDVGGGKLTEVAYFDVMGGPDTAGYDGAWTVYPFLPSGNVLISGMNQGLFVVDPTFDDPPSSPLQTSAAITGVSRDGSTVVVTGSSAFADQPYVAHGTDPTGDAALPGVLGDDLVGASSAVTADGRIKLRFETAQFPPAGGRPGPRVLYARSFCAVAAVGQGTPACWEIHTWSSGSASLDPVVEVRSCADQACTPSSQQLTAIPGTVAIDPSTRTVTTAIALADLQIPSGGQLTPVNPRGRGSAWTALNSTDAHGDSTTIDTAFTLPLRSVALAVGAPGQDPATVTYPAAAAVGSNGAYTGNVDVSGLEPGVHTVYARACFGSTNCGYATAVVTL